MGCSDQVELVVIGPMVELGLPSGFALEFDVLFSRQGYDSAYGTALYDTTTRERANSWEIPILLRYRSRMQRVRPFIEAGYSVRLIHDSAEVEGAYSDGSGGYTSTVDHTKADYTSQGFVAGGGVQFGVGRLQFAPEARYTHWNNRPVSQAYPDGPEFQSTQDQLQILVGVVFKLARESH